LPKNGCNKEWVRATGTVEEGEVFHFGKIQSISQKGQTQVQAENLSNKYVGRWDAGQNKMIWQILEKGEEVQLEKDPVTNTFFPRVGKGTCDGPGQQESSQPHKGLSSKVVRSQTKKTHLKSPVPPKPTAKRSRASDDSGKTHDNQSGLAGKRKLIDEEEEDGEDKSKKGRKSGGDDQSVQAEAGNQPRRQP
jgi:hypothetical protein